MLRALPHRLFVVVSFLYLTNLTISAQQPKVLAPHRAIAPRVEKPVKWLTPSTARTMVGGLWMTDANFKSSIYLSNSVETDTIAVTPVLHLSNGKQYKLPEVTVTPSGVAIININDALQQLGLSSWATLSGYAELQYNWPWDPFCATIRNVDVAHSVIFVYGLQPTAPLSLPMLNAKIPLPTHTMEGMWWKQEANVTGFVSVANLSTQPAHASVQVTDDRGQTIAQRDVTVTAHGMKLVDLKELVSTTGRQGGVRVTSSTTTMDQLAINGGLQDSAVGYSARIPFARPVLGPTPVDFSKAAPSDIAELGLMVGVADPMMLFPQGTTFTPYSVLRNVSASPASVTPTLWWMEGGASRSAQLPPVSLAPYQSQSLDVPALLALYGPKNFNGSFNLVFSGSVVPGSLLLASGSVDQTHNYVFESIARGVAESASKSLQYWSTGNGDDTMVTLWNAADEAQDFTFTLFFKGGHYLFPIHLEPRAIRGFSVSEIIQNPVPDSEGNVIPASVHEGSARLSGSLGENQHILIAMDSGTYNVRRATCFGNCQECDGVTQAALLNSPFTVAVNGTHQLHFMLTYNTGSQYDVTTTSTWSSNKTTVATVAGGNVTGKSKGSLTITGSIVEPVGLGWVCPGEGGCPNSTYVPPDPGTVQGCPTSITLSGTTPLSLVNASSNSFPYLKTGVGVLTAMQVHPPTQADGTTWDGTVITETVYLNNINTCPSSVQVNNVSGGILTVGQGGGTTFGVPVPPTSDVFWDEHARASTSSWLNAPGVTQSACTQAYSQIYSCNGIPIASFYIVYGFSRGTIQGTPVTTVSVTKQ